MYTFQDDSSRSMHHRRRTSGGMKSFFLCVGHICVLTVAVIFPLVAVYGEVEQVKPDNLKFSFAIFSRLRTEKGNIVFSPFSIEQALGMTLLGAKGETAQELRQALSLNGKGDDARLTELSSAIQRHATKGEVQCDIANGVWMQREGEITDSFLKVVKEHFSAQFEQVDFVTSSQTVRREINVWVSAITKGKIVDLLSAEHVTSLTRLILVNAVYFKANWLAPFDDALNQRSDFWEAEGDKRSTTLMFRFGAIPYAENDTVQMVKLPYRGGSTSMIVLLPKKRGTLADVESHLTETDFAQLRSLMRTAKVELYLPKFKVAQKQSLVDVFRKLGATLPFSFGNADFSGIDGTKNLAISEIVHSSVVEVDEEGSEASAATAVVVTKRSAQPQQAPVVFRADHPFLFFIVEESTGGILFMGRVAQPTQ